MKLFIEESMRDETNWLCDDGWSFNMKQKAYRK